LLKIQEMWQRRWGC